MSDALESIKERLLHSTNDSKDDDTLLQILQGKLCHLSERLDSPPALIVEQLKIFASFRPDLFRRGDCQLFLKKIMRHFSKGQSKRTSMTAGESSPLAVLAANTLFRANCLDEQWSIEFIDLYLEDSLGSRQWVDSPETTIFSQNLLFWTIPRSHIQTSQIYLSSVSSSAVKHSSSLGYFEGKTSKESIGAESGSFSTASQHRTYGEVEGISEGNIKFDRTHVIPERGDVLKEFSTRQPSPSTASALQQQLEVKQKGQSAFVDSDDSSGDEEVIEESSAFSLNHAIMSRSMEATSTATSEDDSSGAEEVLEEGNIDTDSSKPSKSLFHGSLTAPNDAISSRVIASTERELSLSIRGELNENSVIDRFTHIKNQVTERVVDVLRTRTGLSQPNQFGSSTTGPSSVHVGTWTVVSTMSSFCGLPEVRRMASVCLDRWLGNPAIVESVRKLVQRIADCLESADIYTNTQEDAREGNWDDGRLIESDMRVVEEIVKLRSILKASQTDLYKGILIVVAKRGEAVARLIVSLLVSEDIAINSARAETVKLLASILSALQDASSISSKQLQLQLEAPGLVKYARASRVLGEAVALACVTATRVTTSVGSSSCSGSATGGQEVGCWLTWLPTQSRVVVDIIVRTVKTLGLKFIAYGALLSGLLGDEDIAATALRRAQAQTQFQVQQSIISGPGASAGTRTHPLDIEIVQFFGDVTIALQLLCGHEIMVMEKELKEKIQFSAATANSNKGMWPPNTSIPISADVTPRGGVGGRSGGALGSRGGGRIGRGSAALSSASLPSMFRSSALRSTGRTTVAAGVTSGASSIGATNIGTGAAVGTISGGVAGSADASSSSESIASLEARFATERERLMKSSAEIQEVAAKWLLGVYQAFKAPSANTLGRSRSIIDVQRDKMKGKRVFLAPFDAELQSGWLDWLQKAFCLNAFAVSKVQVDLDKQASYFIRENGFLTNGLLEYLIDFTLLTSVTPANVSSGLALMDALAQRAVKSSIADGSVGLLVDDLQIIPRLFQLTRLTLVPKKKLGCAFSPLTDTTMDMVAGDVLSSDVFPKTMSVSVEFSNEGSSLPDAVCYQDTTESRDFGRLNIETNDNKIPTRPLPTTPYLAHKDLYWRVATFCYLLGCARPDCLGKFLWQSIPSVKTLMLMSISGRFFYPPSSDVAADVFVGNKKKSQANTSVNAVAPANVTVAGSYKHSNGIEVLVTNKYVEVQYGRVQDIEVAIRTIEEQVWEYLFNETPPAPVASLKEFRSKETSVTKAEAAAAAEASARARRLKAREKELQRIELERQAQLQRREIERSSRAERAAARSARLGGRDPVPYSTSTSTTNPHVPLRKDSKHVSSTSKDDDVVPEKMSDNPAAKKAKFTDNCSPEPASRLDKSGSISSSMGAVTSISDSAPRFPTEPLDTKSSTVRDAVTKDSNTVMTGSNEETKRKRLRDGHDDKTVTNTAVTATATSTFVDNQQDSTSHPTGSISQGTTTLTKKSRAAEDIDIKSNVIRPTLADRITLSPVDPTDSTAVASSSLAPTHTLLPSTGATTSVAVTITSTSTSTSSVAPPSSRKFTIPRLTHRSPSPYTTQFGFVEKCDFIFLSSKTVPRAPPEEVIKAVKALSVKHKFGARLRGCTQPDFISRALVGDASAGSASTVSRSAVERSVGWLIPAISVDVDAILARIPNIAACHLLLMTALKVYNRVNRFNVWTDDSGGAKLLQPTSASFSTTSFTAGYDVDAFSIMLFDGEEDLLGSLFTSTDHVTDMKLLNALVAKMYNLLLSTAGTADFNREVVTGGRGTDIVGTNDSANYSETVRDHEGDHTSAQNKDNDYVQDKEREEVLKVILKDMFSKRPERRCASRLTLSFLNAWHRQQRSSSLACDVTKPPALPLSSPMSSGVSSALAAYSVTSSSNPSSGPSSGKGIREPGLESGHDSSLAYADGAHSVASSTSGPPSTTAVRSTLTNASQPNVDTSSPLPIPSSSRPNAHTDTIEQVLLQGPYYCDFNAIIKQFAELPGKLGDFAGLLVCESYSRTIAVEMSVPVLVQLLTTLTDVQPVRRRGPATATEAMVKLLSSRPMTAQKVVSALSHSELLTLVGAELQTIVSFCNGSLTTLTSRDSKLLKVPNDEECSSQKQTAATSEMEETEKAKEMDVDIDADIDVQECDQDGKSIDEIIVSSAAKGYNVFTSTGARATLSSFACHESYGAQFASLRVQKNISTPLLPVSGEHSSKRAPQSKLVQVLQVRVDLLRAIFSVAFSARSQKEIISFPTKEDNLDLDNYSGDNDPHNFFIQCVAGIMSAISNQELRRFLYDIVGSLRQLQDKDHCAALLAVMPSHTVLRILRDFSNFTITALEACAERFDNDLHSGTLDSWEALLKMCSMKKHDKVAAEFVPLMRIAFPAAYARDGDVAVDKNVPTASPDASSILDCGDVKVPRYVDPTALNERQRRLQSFAVASPCLNKLFYISYFNSFEPRPQPKDHICFGSTTLRNVDAAVEVEVEVEDAVAETKEDSSEVAICIQSESDIRPCSEEEPSVVSNKCQSQPAETKTNMTTTTTDSSSPQEKFVAALFEGKIPVAVDEISFQLAHEISSGVTSLQDCLMSFMTSVVSTTSPLVDEYAEKGFNIVSNCFDAMVMALVGQISLQDVLPSCKISTKKSLIAANTNDISTSSSSRLAIIMQAACWLSSMPWLCSQMNTTSLHQTDQLMASFSFSFSSSSFSLQSNFFPIPWLVRAKAMASFTTPSCGGMVELLRAALSRPKGTNKEDTVTSTATDTNHALAAAENTDFSPTIVLLKETLSTIYDVIQCSRKLAACKSISLLSKKDLKAEEALIEPVRGLTEDMEPLDEVAFSGVLDLIPEVVSYLYNLSTPCLLLGQVGKDKRMHDYVGRFLTSCASRRPSSLIKDLQMTSSPALHLATTGSFALNGRSFLNFPSSFNDRYQSVVSDCEGCTDTDEGGALSGPEDNMKPLKRHETMKTPARQSTEYLAECDFAACIAFEEALEECRELLNRLVESDERLAISWVRSSVDAIAHIVVGDAVMSKYHQTIPGGFEVASLSSVTDKLMTRPGLSLLRSALYCAYKAYPEAVLCTVEGTVADIAASHAVDEYLKSTLNSTASTTSITADKEEEIEQHHGNEKEKEEEVKFGQKAAVFAAHKENCDDGSVIEIVDLTGQASSHCEALLSGDNNADPQPFSIAAVSECKQDQSPYEHSDGTPIIAAGEDPIPHKEHKRTFEEFRHTLSEALIQIFHLLMLVEQEAFTTASGEFVSPFFREDSSEGQLHNKMFGTSSSTSLGAISKIMKVFEPFHAKDFFQEIIEDKEKRYVDSQAQAPLLSTEVPSLTSPVSLHPKVSWPGEGSPPISVSLTTPHKLGRLSPSTLNDVGTAQTVLGEACSRDVTAVPKYLYGVHLGLSGTDTVPPHISQEDVESLAAEAAVDRASVTLVRSSSSKAGEVSGSSFDVTIETSGISSEQRSEHAANTYTPRHSDKHRDQLCFFDSSLLLAIRALTSRSASQQSPSSSSNEMKTSTKLHNRTSNNSSGDKSSQSAVAVASAQFSADRVALVSSASSTLLTIARRHPVLWLRLLPNLARELKVSTQLTLHTASIGFNSSNTSINGRSRNVAIPATGFGSISHASVSTTDADGVRVGSDAGSTTLAIPTPPSSGVVNDYAEGMSKAAKRMKVDKRLMQNTKQKASSHLTDSSSSRPHHVSEKNPGAGGASTSKHHTPGKKYTLHKASVPNSGPAPPRMVSHHSDGGKLIAVGIDRDRSLDRQFSVVFFSREVLRPMVYEELWWTAYEALKELPAYLLEFGHHAELSVSGLMLEEQVVELMCETASRRLHYRECFSAVPSSIRSRLGGGSYISLPPIEDSLEEHLLMDMKILLTGASGMSAERSELRRLENLLESFLSSGQNSGSH